MKKLVSLLMLSSSILLSAKVLTLNQAVETAFRNSHDMQVQEVDNEKVNSSYNSVLWDIVPEADVNWSWQKNNQGIGRSAGFTFSKSLTSTLPEYFNWTNAKHNIEINKLQEAQNRKEIAWNVLNTYIDLLLSQKKLSIYNENYSIQKDLLEEAKILKDQGRKSVYDYNQVEINTLNSELDLIQAKKSVSDNIRELKLVLNIEADTLSLADIDIPTDRELDYDIENESSYSLQLKESNISHDKYMLNQEKIRFLPDLSLSYNHSYSSSNGYDDFDDSYTLGLGISYSLWNFFEHGQEYYRSKLNISSSEIELDRELMKFKKDFRQNQDDLANLRIKKKINDKILAQAKENFEIAKTNFNLGLIKAIELEESKTDLNDAKVSNLELGYQLYLKEEAINYLLSKEIAGKW